LYGYEDVISPDPQKGLFWLQEAASQSFPQALYALGKHYLEGQYLEVTIVN
jgi:TPR repeat protein